MTAFYYRRPPSKRWVLHSVHATPEAAWNAALEFPERHLALWFAEVPSDAPDPTLLTGEATFTTASGGVTR